MKNILKTLVLVFLPFSCSQIQKNDPVELSNTLKIDNSDALVLPTLKNDSLIVKNRKLYAYFTDSLDFFNNVTQFQKIGYSLSLCNLEGLICDTIIFKINMPNRSDGDVEASDSYQKFLNYKNIYANDCVKILFDEIFNYESFDPGYRLLNNMNMKFGYAVHGDNVLEKAFCGEDIASWLNIYLNEKKHNRFGLGHGVIDIYERTILELDEDERNLHSHMFTLFKTCSMAE